MASAHQVQREELTVLEASLAIARSSIPAAANSAPTPDYSQPPAMVRFFTDPTPHYARQSSWPARLFARWLAATGREWK